eukprot:TRINITY_DN4412_c0_g1_i3.p1 TRINITY_DN4412_c0_g1~~TRINITY_DN4412_c0_g1_i3.p1  ORF type:complete len:229 (+),score=38.54 TRINITY_DN4412_c0_g1_i3:75-761(+)
MEKLTKQNIKTILESVDNFLFDCDGVLWRSGTVIEGIPATLQLLRRLGKKLYFVSNNSSSSREQYRHKMEGLGIQEVKKEEIFPSSYCIAAYLESIGFNKKVAVIGESGIKNELEEAGFKYVDADQSLDKTSNINYIKQLEEVELDKDIGAVVIGWDHHFNYYKLGYAKLLITEQNCLFVATNTDSTFPAGKGRFLPGSGSLVASLSTATGKQPVVVGKPSKLSLIHI